MIALKTLSTGCQILPSLERKESNGVRKGGTEVVFLTAATLPTHVNVSTLGHVGCR